MLCNEQQVGNMTGYKQSILEELRFSEVKKARGQADKNKKLTKTKQNTHLNFMERFHNNVPQHKKCADFEYLVICGT